MILHPNAKINIGLNVLEKRQDGYHNIETVFYPVCLTDVLNIEVASERLEPVFTQSGIKINENQENNLVMRAYRLLQEIYQIPSITVFLDKRIPFGAGLGGGSSDAAYTLKALNELFNLSVSDKELEDLAAKLGADCAFFIKNRPVFASGIGNEFTPVALSLKGYYLLLVKPDIFISTPQAYSMLKPFRPEDSLQKLITLPVDKWKNQVKNDFEIPVFLKYPEIQNIKNRMYELGAVYASMSGSGSSVYGIFENRPEIPASFAPYFTHISVLE